MILVGVFVGVWWKACQASNVFMALVCEQHGAYETHRDVACFSGSAVICLILDSNVDVEGAVRKTIAYGVNTKRACARTGDWAVVRKLREPSRKYCIGMNISPL